MKFISPIHQVKNYLSPSHLVKIITYLLSELSPNSIKSIKCFVFVLKSSFFFKNISKSRYLYHIIIIILIILIILIKKFIQQQNSFSRWNSFIVDIHTIHSSVKLITNNNDKNSIQLFHGKYDKAES